MPQAFERRFVLTFHLKFVRDDMSELAVDGLLPGEIQQITNMLESDFSHDIEEFINPANGFVVNRHGEPSVSILRQNNEFNIKIEQPVHYNDTFDYDSFIDDDQARLENMLENYNNRDIYYLQAPHGQGTYYYNVYDIAVDMGVEDPVQHEQLGGRRRKSRHHRKHRTTARRVTRRRRASRRNNRKH